MQPRLGCATVLHSHRIDPTEIFRTSSAQFSVTVMEVTSRSQKPFIPILSNYGFHVLVFWLTMPVMFHKSIFHKSQPDPTTKLSPRWGMVEKYRNYLENWDSGDKIRLIYSLNCGSSNSPIGNGTSLTETLLMASSAFRALISFLTFKLKI